MKLLKTGLSALLAIGLAMLSGVPASAAGVADRVSINDPYIRAVPPVVKTTAAFMQLQNTNAQEQFVVSAQSDTAAVVELHMHVQDEGVMRMRQIPHIHLPPNQTVSLQPGGLHIMLFDLKQPLSPGDEVPLTLTFDDGSSKQVIAIVRRFEGMMKH